MNFRITHTTKYIYNAKVSICYNESRLTPRNFAGQHCTNSIISVDPLPRLISERIDFFGNMVHYFSVENPQKELIVTAVSYVIRTNDNYQLGIPETLNWEAARDQFRTNLASHIDGRQFLFDSPLIRSSGEIHSYALPSFTPGRSVFEAVHDLMNRIYEDYDFDPEFSNVSTPLSEVMVARKGVCQDFAHLGIACLREMGLPARYVSGYIETLPPPGEARLTGADASHAWFSVYIPNAGWLDFDPTNNQMINAKYITVAYGRDYSDVVPLKGVIFSSGEHQMQVSVDVLNIDVN